MNKTAICLFASLLLYVSACKKETTTPTCSPSDTTQTFTAKVKPIIDANCITSGCHDATASGGVNLTTYDGVVSATKNNNLISQVQSGLMPQGLPALPDSSINKIIAWKDNCYQQ